MSKKAIEKEIIDFLEFYTVMDVNEDTLLFLELKMEGLDADNLIDKFASRFNVDITTMNIDKYLITYDILPSERLYWKLFKPHKLKRKTFKLNHLIEVIEKGIWFDPE